MSIRARLLLLVLSVLLPAALAVVWLVAQAYDVERKANERTLRETSRALSMVVDQELTQRVLIGRQLALSRTLADAPDVPPPMLQAFAAQARRAMQGLDGWVELVDTSGVLMDTRLPEGELPPRAEPAAASRLSDTLVVRPLQAGAGGTVASAAVVRPIQRGGRTVLNLVVTILPRELQHIIDEQKLPGDWVAAVVDTQGTVVARHPGGTAYAGRAATQDVKDRLAAHREGLLDSTSLDGQRVTSYFSTSSRGWTYITAMPRDQFGGFLPRAVLQVALGAFALLGIAVAAAVWVSRSIAGPVTALKNAAARMKAGQPVARLLTGIVECDEVKAALADAADSIRESRADLERRVAEGVARTRDAEQRLAQSQRVEALGRLTGGVAHDFNNLLGVISNSAHLIQRQASGPELDVPVAATLRAVEVGSRLTQHLLRFAGRQPMHPRTVDLARYLPEIVELMGTVVGHRIAVSVAVAPGTRCVVVDPSELELALINLALNARDAIPASGHVWLRAGNAEAADTEALAAGDYVLLSVSDDGNGIDDSLAERVFEPFFSTKTGGQGTGLGLSQVHGFCVQAGGTARMASTPGLGTTVSLLLPTGSDAPDTAPAAVPPDQAPDMAGKRVLLVEDHVELGDVTAALLESYGAQVQRADSPEQALILLDTGPRCDVVLTDVVMPGGMDGIELAQLLRRRRPTLPVVLITGYSSALGAAHDFTVLRKPCAPDDVVDTLRRAMRCAPAVV